MKIAVWHNLPSGGGKRSLYYHVKGLLENGHKVESWCPPTADRSYMASLGEIVTEHVVPFDWKPAVSANPMALWSNFSKKIKAMEAHSRECAREMKSGGFDLLFANTCALFGAPSIGRYVDLPKVLFLQEPNRRLYEALPKLPWVAPDPPSSFTELVASAPGFLKDLGKVQLLRAQMREETNSAAAYDRILVNSLFSRESVLRAYGLDSKVCYLGVDTDFFRPLGVTREKFVVGLGSVCPAKGVQRAITAVASIPKEKRPEIMWLGNFSEEKYQKNIESLARDLDVKITFIMCPSQEKILDVLNRASLLIYTSFLEPLGLAPLEANACGTPVVAIAEGGTRETVKDGVNGLLVRDDDPVKLGRAVSRVLEDRELLGQMNKRCREHVLDGWTWKTSVECLEKNFSDVLIMKSAKKENGH